jgi:hypothetical protein
MWADQETGCWANTICFNCENVILDLAMYDYCNLSTHSRVSNLVHRCGCSACVCKGFSQHFLLYILCQGNQQSFMKKRFSNRRSIVWALKHSAICWEARMPCHATQQDATWAKTCCYIFIFGLEWDDSGDACTRRQWCWCIDTGDA